MGPVSGASGRRTAGSDRPAGREACIRRVRALRGGGGQGTLAHCGLVGVRGTSGLRRYGFNHLQRQPFEASAITASTIYIHVC